MSSSRYAVELFLNKVPHTVIFERLPRQNDINPPNMTSKQQLEWNSMYKHEYPVHVCEIDRVTIVDGYAVAKTREWEYGGIGLAEIELNGESYLTPREVIYWFPETDRPVELVDGSVRVYLNAPADGFGVSVVFLNPTGAMPYLGETGVFKQDYMIVTKSEITAANKYQYSRCQVPVTLWNDGKNFTKMVNRGNPLMIWTVQCTMTYRECMPISEFEEAK